MATSEDSFYLPAQILWRIADGPVAFRDLLFWVRVQRPRVLPDAVGMTLCGLRRAGFVEPEGERWRIKVGN